MALAARDLYGPAEIRLTRMFFGPRLLRQLHGVDLQRRLGRGHAAAVMRHHAVAAQVGQADRRRPVRPVLHQRQRRPQQRRQRVGADAQGRQVRLAAGVDGLVRDLRAEGDAVDEDVDLVAVGGDALASCPGSSSRRAWRSGGRCASSRPRPPSCRSSTSQGKTFSTLSSPCPNGRTRDSASRSRSRMFSTMVIRRGWTEKSSRAPAACRCLAMCQAKPMSSPTPVTRATLPVRSRGIMIVLGLQIREVSRAASVLASRVASAPGGCPHRRMV